MLLFQHHRLRSWPRPDRADLVETFAFQALSSLLEAQAWLEGSAFVALRVIVRFAVAPVFAFAGFSAGAR